MNFRKPLEEYRDLTLNLIENAKKNEELSNLIDKRDNVLKEFDRVDYSEEEFRKIVKEFNIIELDNELQLIVKKEMVQIKRKIENIRKSRVAKSNYTKSQQEEYKLFISRA